MNSSAVLISGAGTRLGKLFARHMATSGYDVAIHCNNSLESARALAAELQEMGCAAEVFPQDFTEAFDTDAYLADVQRVFPNLCCLLNNASAYAAAPSAKTDRALLETQFRVNLVTPFLMTASFAKQIASEKANSSKDNNGPIPQVINILDNKIGYHQFQYAAYLLSKQSLAEYTRLAALEFAPFLRVNGISPGVTLPGETRTDDYVQWRLEGIPLQRQGQDKELMAALGYLLENEFVTGQILTVDGGESINQVGRNHENYPGGSE